MGWELPRRCEIHRKAEAVSFSRMAASSPLISPQHGIMEQHAVAAATQGNYIAPAGGLGDSGQAGAEASGGTHSARLGRGRLQGGLRRNLRAISDRLAWVSATVLNRYCRSSSVMFARIVENGHGLLQPISPIWGGRCPRFTRCAWRMDSRTLKYRDSIMTAKQASVFHGFLPTPSFRCYSTVFGLLLSLATPAVRPLEGRVF